MSSADEEQSPGEISDEMLTEMVRHLRSSWTLEKVERVEEGVNSTVVLSVNTSIGDRRTVLKAITSSHPLAADRARAEPMVLSLLQRETAVPVPVVFGTCDDHETYPTPYFLMEYVDGETISAADAPNLSFDIRKTIFREAGLNLAGLHALGPLDEVGDLVGKDGKVSVLDTPETPSHDVFHDWLLESYEETLDQLLDEGGYFPELTENPNRFDDLVPEIRDYLRGTIPDLPPSQPPTYCHKDYGYSVVPNRVERRS